MKTNGLSKISWLALMMLTLLVNLTACSSDQPGGGQEEPPQEPQTQEPQTQEPQTQEPSAALDYSIEGVIYSDVFIDGKLELHGYVPRGIMRANSPYIECAKLGHEPVKIAIKGQDLKLEKVEYNYNSDYKYQVDKEDADCIELKFDSYQEEHYYYATIYFSENGHKREVDIANNVAWDGGHIYDYEEYVSSDKGWKTNYTIFSMLTRSDADGGEYILGSKLVDYEFLGQKLIQNLHIVKAIAYEYDGWENDRMKHDTFEVEVSPQQKGKEISFILPAEDRALVYLIYYEMDVRQLDGTMIPDYYRGLIQIYQNIPDEDYDAIVDSHRYDC